jgi:outer membrane protein OmpA-like peptidoglycan-associated protein
MRTISYGEIQPLDPEENETAWAKNRRVAFTF